MRLIRGFAALPMLAAITLLSGGALFLLAMNSFGDRQTAAEAQSLLLNDAHAAVDGFALTWGRLPCPDTNNDGLEDCSTGQVTGFLPLVTLGIADQRAGQIGYAPYHKSDSDGLGAATDIIGFDLPSELPAGTTTTVPAPAEPAIPGGQISAEDLERAKAIYGLEGFYAGIISGSAVNLAGDTVSNTIGRSYISVLRDTYLVVVIDVPGDDLDFKPGNANHDKLLSLTDNLQTFVHARRTKELIGDNPAVEDDLPGRINQLDKDLAKIAAGETPDGSCTGLDCVKTTWASYRDEYNGVVSSYNAARLPGVAAMDSYSFSDSDLDSTVQQDRVVALQKAISSLRDAVNGGNEVIGQTLNAAADASLAGDPNEVTNLKNRYEDLAGQAATRKGQAQAELATEQGKAPEDQNAATIARLQGEIAGYETARKHYADLATLLGQLQSDLSSEHVTAFTDAMGQGLPENPPGPVLDPDATCTDLAEGYSSPPFDMDACKQAVSNGTLNDYIDSLGEPTAPTGTSVTPPTTAVSYTGRSNLFDLCQKLHDLPAASEPSLRSGGNTVAYILVGPGDNRVLDAPNVVGSGALNAAAPDQAQTLTYDDRLRAVNAAELENRLSCSGLLNARVSYNTAVKEIALLYDDAVSALGDAEQDEVMAGIMLAINIARLAADIGAIAQESASGAVKTAICVASLGFAVNACASAGFSFAAAVAHGVAVVTDGVNVAQAGIALADAVQSLNDAQDAKDTIQSHYATVVSAAIKADAYDGIRELD